MLFLTSSDGGWEIESAGKVDDWRHSAKLYLSPTLSGFSVDKPGQPTISSAPWHLADYSRYKYKSVSLVACKPLRF